MSEAVSTPPNVDLNKKKIFKPVKGFIQGGGESVFFKYIMGLTFLTMNFCAVF